MPQGFSIFCTIWEASKVKQFMQLSQEEQEKLGLVDSDEKNKDEDVLKEPIPRVNYCHLCGRRFDDYLLHIESKIHRNSISKNRMMINTVQDSFKRINDFWNNKNNKNKTNKNNYINKISNEKNKLILSNANSSFSSAVSTFKYEESLIRDINSFILEPELSDIEKSNDKENICDNTNNNKKQIKNKKSKHSKNDTHFVTPIKKEKSFENKFSSHLSSSQSSLNIFINKKRKENNDIKCEKNNKFDEEDQFKRQKDYFANLRTSKSKKLINNTIVFFE